MGNSTRHHMGIRSILSSLGMCSSESRPKNDVQRYDNKYVNILRGFHSSSLSQAELAPGDYTGAKLKLAPEDYQMYADLKNALAVDPGALIYVNGASIKPHHPEEAVIIPGGLRTHLRLSKGSRQCALPFDVYDRVSVLSYFNANVHDRRPLTLIAGLRRDSAHPFTSGPNHRQRIMCCNRLPARWINSARLQQSA